MKRMILLFLAGIGTLTILVLVSSIVFSGFSTAPDEHDFNIQSEQISPQGDFKAIHYLGMGGGAAGWCNEIVSIEPISSSQSSKTDKFTYRVFTISCGSKIDFQWLGNSLLHINFFPKDSLGGASIYLRNSDESGKIKIEYTYKA